MVQAQSPQLCKIRKRNGSQEAFQPGRIAAAIRKALAAGGEGSPALAEEISEQVVRQLRELGEALPGVEQIQDLVEEALMRRGLTRTAKAYILYRQRHAELRQAKALMGVRDDLKLSQNAIFVLKRRYLQWDEAGKVCETPVDLFRRVARTVAAAEDNYLPAERPRLEEAFYQLMVDLDFLPNSPTLMNAGTPVGQLSACFVLPVEDSIESIFDAVKHMALVHQSGGGTGFSFSRLRPRGDFVKSTGGVASGPLSFLNIFDATTGVIKQGGRRRGANMGILRCDHPDIVEFINAKENVGALTNFNLSVGITDAFMAALEQDGPAPLRNPRTGQVTGEIPARELFRMIASQAWRTGEPGVVFLDAINRANPLPQQGPLEATNPCGEQPLLPWESCNLGSINLKNMVVDGHLDEARLERTVALAVRFLDDVIDVNRPVVPQISQVTGANRKIGLGLMGLADALIQLGIPYDSSRALELAEELAAQVQRWAQAASAALAEERGPFPAYPGSRWEARGLRLRNATTTTVAPTGTISVIAGCSSGIEPLFAVSFVRNVIEGSRLLEINPLFETVARARGFWSDELLLEVAQRGSLRGIAAVPEDVQRLFATALDIAPEWHVRMQAAFQRHCDNAVSKTINFPTNAAIGDVETALRLAHSLGCKGITVYRYGSRPGQVLTFGGAGEGGRGDTALVTADAEYAGGCPLGSCQS